MALLPKPKDRVLKVLEGRADAGDTKAYKFLEGLKNSLSQAVDSVSQTIDDVSEFISPTDPQKTVKASKSAFYPPDKQAEALKREYQKEQGLSTKNPPRIKKLDVEEAKRLADEFDSLKHNPNDPKVKAAYDAMAKETIAQYQKMLDSGIKIEYWRGKGEPYKSSREMAEDVSKNKRLKVLATEGNFGQDAITTEQLAENPLLKRTKFTDADGKPLLVNDVFRAVHDYFGHASGGTGFGAVGEKNAYVRHLSMYSDLARQAVNTETNLQNSWVNFGRQIRRPNGEIPQKGDIDYIHPSKKPFGEQKVVISPREISMEDYYALWQKPEFAKKAQQVGFGAAAIALMAMSEEAEGSKFGFDIILDAGRRTVDDVIKNHPARTYRTIEGSNIAKGNPLDVGVKQSHPSDKHISYDTMIRYGWLDARNINNPSLVRSAITRYRNTWDKYPSFRRTEIALKGKEHDITDQQINKRIITPEELEGRVITPIMGDQSRAARTINSYRGIKLEVPVDVHGGSEYPLIHPYGWESMKTAAKAAQGGFDEVARMHDTDDIIAMYSAMSPKSTDFSTMPASLMLQFARGNPSIPKQAKKEFDREFNEYLIKAEKKRLKNLTESLDTGVHTVGDMKGEELTPEDVKMYREEIKDLRQRISSGKSQWSGIDSPEAIDQILGRGNFVKEGTGAFRKHFVKFMSMKKWKDQGFATFDDEMKRTLNLPDLEPVDYGDMGFTMWKAKPNAPLIDDPKTSSYSHAMQKADESMTGGFETSVPPEFVMPDEMKRLSERTNRAGEPYTREQQIGAFRARKDVGQKFTPEAVDLTSTYIEILNSMKGMDIPQQNVRQIAKVMTEAKVHNKGRLSPEQIEKMKNLAGSGVKTAAMITAINGVLALNPDEAKANVFTSGLFKAFGNTQVKRATPEQWKNLLKKQKGASSKELDMMDFSKLGDGLVTREQMEKFISDEAPKIKIEEMSDEQYQMDQMDKFSQEYHEEMMRQREDAISMSAENMAGEMTPNELLDSIPSDRIALKHNMKKTIDGHLKDMGVTDLESAYDQTIDNLFDSSPFRQTRHNPSIEQDMRNAYSAIIFDGGSILKNFRRSDVENSQQFIEYSENEDFSNYDPDNFDPYDVGYSNQEMPYSKYDLDGSSDYHEVYFNLDRGDKKPIKHGHMKDQPNNMAWARLSVRRGENGEKILHVAEIQSDAGKSRSPEELRQALPKDWRKSVFNLILEKAQKEGFDGVSFAKDAEQVDLTEQWNAVERIRKPTIVNTKTGEKFTAERRSRNNIIIRDSHGNPERLRFRMEREEYYYKKALDKWNKQVEESQQKLDSLGSEDELNARMTQLQEEIDRMLYKEYQFGKYFETIMKEKYGATKPYEFSQPLSKTLDDPSFNTADVIEKRNLARKEAGEMYQRQYGEPIETTKQKTKAAAQEHDVVDISIKTVRREKEKLDYAKREVEKIESDVEDLNNLKQFVDSSEDNIDITNEEFVDTSNLDEGKQRVVKQYEVEMPEYAKQITGNDVQKIKSGQYELNYVPLTNKETGQDIPIPKSKFWSIAPVAAAGGYAALQSDPSQAGVVKAASLVTGLRNAASKANLDPDQITVDENGYISYPESYINPLHDVGAGLLRRDVAIHNDAVEGGDFKSEFPKRGYHGAVNREYRAIDGFDHENYSSRGATFVSPDPSFSNRFTGSGRGVVYPLRYAEDNLFDYENSEQVNDLVNSLDPDEIDFEFRNKYEGTISRSLGINKNDVTQEHLNAHVKDLIRSGDWYTIENPIVQQAIQKQGYNSFSVKEQGVKNIGIFDDSRIRSEYAAFDPQFRDSRNLLGQATTKQMAGAGVIGATGMAAQSLWDGSEDDSQESDQFLRMKAEMDKALNQESKSERPEIFSPLSSKMGVTDTEMAPVEGGTAWWEAYPKQFAEDVAGLGEIGLTIGTGMATDAMAGLAGALAGTRNILADDYEKKGYKNLANFVRSSSSADDTYRAASEQLEPSIYMPKGKSGNEYLQNIAGAVQWMMENGGDQASDAYRTKANELHEYLVPIVGEEEASALVITPDILAALFL